MFCPNCGKEVKNDDAVCASCGYELGDSVAKNENAATQNIVYMEAPKRRFCSHCGKEVNPDALVCISCGCALSDMYNQGTRYGYTGQDVAEVSRGTEIAIKIFMILGCVFGGIFYLIPLAWNIPLTVHVFRKLNKKEPVGTGAKICILIFCNLIAGILLLCIPLKNDDR